VPMATRRAGDGGAERFEMEGLGRGLVEHGIWDIFCIARSAYGLYRSAFDGVSTQEIWPIYIWKMAEHTEEFHVVFERLEGDGLHLWHRTVGRRGGATREIPR
jgi:hypothetical protein